MYTLKTKIYTTFRSLSGIGLVFHSFLNTVNYNDFLDRLDFLFTKATIFNNAFFYNTAPLVPFEEFGLGIFLALGLYTRIVLKIGIVLLVFLSLFLIDASTYSMVPYHMGIAITMFILLKCIEFNKDSMDSQIKRHSLL